MSWPPENENATRDGEFCLEDKETGLRITRKETWMYGHVQEMHTYTHSEMNIHAISHTDIYIYVWLVIYYVHVSKARIPSISRKFGQRDPIVYLSDIAYNL